MKRMKRIALGMSVFTLLLTGATLLQGGGTGTGTGVTTYVLSVNN